MSIHFWNYIISDTDLAGFWMCPRGRWKSKYSVENAYTNNFINRNKALRATCLSMLQMSTFLFHRNIQYRTGGLCVSQRVCDARSILFIMKKRRNKITEFKIQNASQQINDLRLNQKAKRILPKTSHFGSYQIEQNGIYRYYLRSAIAFIHSSHITHVAITYSGKKKTLHELRFFLTIPNQCSFVQCFTIYLDYAHTFNFIV